MTRRDALRNLGLAVLGVVVGIGAKAGLKLNNPKVFEIHDTDAIEWRGRLVYLIKKYTYPVAYDNGKRIIIWKNVRAQYLNHDMRWETFPEFAILPDRLYHEAPTKWS